MMAIVTMMATYSRTIGGLGVRMGRVMVANSSRFSIKGRTVRLSGTPPSSLLHHCSITIGLVYNLITTHCLLTE